MAKIMDPQSAAEAIRHMVVDTVSTADRHMHSFIGRVCQFLGIDHNPANAASVATALARADIQPHVIQDYPKMLTDDKGKAITDREGHPVVFKDEAAEKAYQPDPEAVAERVKEEDDRSRANNVPKGAPEAKRPEASAKDAGTKLPV